jgi:tRNA (cmo5U34)-methyltransferase
MAQTENIPRFNAKTYDREVRTVVPFYDMMMEEVLDVVAALKPAPKVWLDTGCGTGYLVGKALAMFPKTQFVLSDPLENMMEGAKTRLQNLRDGRVSYLPPSRSENLALFKDELKPQVITAVLCHHFLQADERLTATKTCFDLLEPGGVYVTVEHTAALNETTKNINMTRWRRFQMAHGRDSDEVEKHLLRYGTKFFPISAAQHIQLLKEVGFKTAEVYWASFVDTGFYAVKP